MRGPIGRLIVCKSPIWGLHLSLSTCWDMGVSFFERPIGHLRARKSPIGGLRLSLSACWDMGVSLFERPIGHLRVCEPLIGGFRSCSHADNSRCRGDLVVGHQGLYGHANRVSSSWPLRLGIWIIITLISCQLAFCIVKFVSPLMSQSFIGCKVGVVGWPPLLYALYSMKLLR